LRSRCSFTWSSPTHDRAVYAPPLFKPGDLPDYLGSLPASFSRLSPGPQSPNLNLGVQQAPLNFPSGPINLSFFSSSLFLLFFQSRPPIEQSWFSGEPPLSPPWFSRLVCFVLIIGGGLFFFFRFHGFCPFCFFFCNALFSMGPPPMLARALKLSLCLAFFLSVVCPSVMGSLWGACRLRCVLHG